MLTGPLATWHSWLSVEHFGLMRLLIAALIVSSALVLGIAATKTRALFPAPSKGPAQGIVWAGETFATRADFARWLRSQGTSYRAWARSHPAQAGLTSRGQKHSGLGPRLLAAIGAFLAALALGVALVHRRWPGSGAAAAELIGVVALWGVALAEAGARATRRRAIPTARRSAALAAAGASRARHGLGRPLAHRLEILALRAAAAAREGARTTRRWAAQRSAALAADPTFSARRSEYVWYVTMALVAAGIGVVLTISLNGG